MSERTAPSGNPFHAMEGYGFDIEVNDISVSCCISESAIARWGPGLGCSRSDFRRMRRLGRTILAQHLKMAGAKRGESWLARITADAVALAANPIAESSKPASADISLPSATRPPIGS